MEISLGDNVEKEEQTSRIVSIDQLRGYAIFGMLIVNAGPLFFEPMQAKLSEPWFETFLYQIQHHRTAFTYADTIAPLFVFVVGMGMRLSWLRRGAVAGFGATRKAMVKRNILLVLIAFALYPGWLWDALMDIGLAGLITIPIIGLSARIRIAAGFALVIVYQVIFMTTSYATWLTHGQFSMYSSEYVPLLVQLIPLNDQLFAVGLNGGLLGPLSWAMILLFGTVAWDVMAERNDKKLFLTCLGWGIGLCAMAYALHMEWPTMKDAWPFSARYMTAPFPLWATGLCFFHLAAFYIICDRLKYRIPTFTSVGQNPLVIYIAQCLTIDVASGFAPEQLSPLAGASCFILFWAIFAVAAYLMQKKRIFIKL